MDTSNFWLEDIAGRIETDFPDGEITVSSGVSPSGKYHLGTLREIMTAEALARALRLRGRTVRHLHVVDDLDVFRKVPADLPAEFEQHLGKPLCDIPSPEGTDQSYADYFVQDLGQISAGLGLDMEIIRAHERYRAGFFVPAIETALSHIEQIKQILVEVSGHQLGEEWSPVQVIEDGHLKTRKFVGLHQDDKTIEYIDQHGQSQSASYAQGDVKLNWRIDWPARWWLLGVQVEPFGRDHATKGGSYDTGQRLVKEIFNSQPPVPVPYQFINRTGETKKMSKSAGNVVTAVGLLDIMPPEIIWYFMLRSAPSRELKFDEGKTLMQLFDDFSALLSKPDKSPAEDKLLEVCLHGIEQPTVSTVPFSHLVASYQASLKDPSATLEVIKRTEHAAAVQGQSDIIEKELAFIDNWLKTQAPAEVKFELSQRPQPDKFSTEDKAVLSALADKIAGGPPDADGEWFHKRIYELKEEFDRPPKQLFVLIYRALIGQEFGPRAGWFLSQLDRSWLIKRLRLEE